MEKNTILTSQILDGRLKGNRTELGSSIHSYLLFLRGPVCPSKNEHVLLDTWALLKLYKVHGLLSPLSYPAESTAKTLGRVLYQSKSVISFR